MMTVLMYVIIVVLDVYACFVFVQSHKGRSFAK